MRVIWAWLTEEVVMELKEHDISLITGKVRTTQIQPIEQINPETSVMIKGAQEVAEMASIRRDKAYFGLEDEKRSKLRDGTTGIQNTVWEGTSMSCNYTSILKIIIFLSNLEFRKMTDQSLVNKYMKIVGVVALYWSVSISLVFVNKALLKGDELQLDAPLFVTFYQCVCTVILCKGTLFEINL